ncbi:MAG: RNA-binding transcriptional accessory protein, partial [Lachnospiraceae bacterium]|nr:RNA-binding transcriptional accessory protein [Lachnospiraceae bacterium]
MNINKIIADELSIKLSQVDAAVKLIDEGNTIPFISRYRKEATGALNDEQLRNLYDRLTYLRNLDEKKATVLSSIEEQGLLTDELKAQINDAMTMVVLEDLYRPYRPKRRTKASIAKEKGLEGLANIILLQMTKKPLNEEAKAYLNPEKEVNTIEDAINGAKDIIAENISDDADYRMWIRKYTFNNGSIVSKAKDEKAESVYEMYYDYSEAVKKVPGHRVLAINRGEAEKVLTAKISVDEEQIIKYLESKVIVNNNENTVPQLKEAITDAFSRLIFPSIEREIRNELTEKAEDSAINVFGKNLEQLLLQPPVSGHVVLGWDPAFRTG